MDTTHFYLSKDGTIHNEHISCYVKFLSVSRIRDKNTGQERLYVKLYDRYEDPEPYAITSCGLLDIQSDLIRLRDFGFLTARKEIMRMVKMIEGSYYELDCVIDEGERTLEKDLPEILRLICQYIKGSGIEAKNISGNDVYNIPVVDFKALFKASLFAGYRNTDIRRMLRDTAHTVCTPGRCDNTVKDDNNEPIKVISFFADELTEVMQELMETVNE